MRKKILTLAIAIATVAGTSSVFAGKDANSGSNGAANGQPFQALQSQIDANAALIASNGGSLADLQIQINSLNSQIGAVEATIETLEANIATNTAGIDSAMALISTTQENVDDVAADLSALAEAHAFDIGLINETLVDVQAELVNLNTARETLASNLATQLSLLSGAVDSNAVAIDSLLLNLLIINANLTSINSDILNLSLRQDALEATSASYAALLANLGGQITSLESSVATLQGYHTTLFSGIQTNLSLSSLNGWSICYSTNYSAGTNPEDIEAACSGSKIMLACRPTGSGTLTVAAYANRNEVFLNTGDSNNVVHTANGVDWYLSGNYSMGFAPVGEGVSRTSADTKNSHNGDRLSWHTHDYGAGGYRCGSTNGLNGSNAWEKLVLSAE